MLIGHFGVDQINDVGGQAGFQHPHLARKFIDTAAIVRVQHNVTTPADMGLLLYLIERGAHEDTPTIASAAFCREMIKVMMGQTDREKIPGGIPPGIPIANKTGEITGTRNDIAVIDPYGNTPIILTILTKGLTDYEAANSAILKLPARCIGAGTVVLARLRLPASVWRGADHRRAGSFVAPIHGGSYSSVFLQRPKVMSWLLPKK